jgi:hypothetical protein
MCSTKAKSALLAGAKAVTLNLSSLAIVGFLSPSHFVE